MRQLIRLAELGAMAFVLAFAVVSVAGADGEEERHFEVAEEVANAILDADEETARAIIEELMAAETAEAQYVLADLYYYGIGVEQNHQLSVELFAKAAEKGSLEAYIRLAYAYIHGEGVEQNAEKGIALLKIAAEQGNVAAQHEMGWFHLLGMYGVPEDCEIVTKWFKLAAEQGDPDAQNRMGNLYAMGKCVEKDPSIAASWFEKAAEADHPTAQRHLGSMLLEGDGIPQDKIRGYMWLFIAFGDENMSSEVDLKFMSLAEIREAERLADEWRKKHRSRDTKN